MQQRTMSKRIRFAFTSEAKRDDALKELSGSSKFRHLTTSILNTTNGSEPCYYLFVQTTGSLIYDLVAKDSIAAIMNKYGGDRA